MLRPKLVLLLTEILQKIVVLKKHSLWYLCDTGSHVVRATIQQIDNFD